MLTILSDSYVTIGNRKYYNSRWKINGEHAFVETKSQNVPDYGIGQVPVGFGTGYNFNGNYYSNPIPEKPYSTYQDLDESLGKATSPTAENIKLILSSTPELNAANIGVSFPETIGSNWKYVIGTKVATALEPLNLEGDILVERPTSDRISIKITFVENNRIDEVIHDLNY